MELIFERSRPGRGSEILPPWTCPPPPFRRSTPERMPPACPRSGRVICPALPGPGTPGLRGVRRVLPLGSCTMKYNPKLGEEMAALPGFTGIHPLQPAHTVKGCQLA